METGTRNAVKTYKDATELTERESTILKMIQENNQLTAEEVMAALDISRATVFREYTKIKNKVGISYDKKTGLELEARVQSINNFIIIFWCPLPVK